ncbi:hypothetical protein HDV02_006124 [Globomyces sp. JEL0801]|nr:hypothetical protein HDV02_006124 [Globomyces sp. JEL0801]
MQDENPFEAAIEAEHAWSTKDIGRNSISGILTEVPTSGVTSFLTNSIGGLKSDSTPAIPSVPLRRVKLSEFTPYLTSINDVIDKYQLHKALGPTSFEGIPLLNSNAYNEEDDKTLEKLQSIIPMKVPKSMDRLKRTRMLSANPQVKKIPEIFQDKSFDLKNPHTFSAIVDYKDVIGLSATNEEAIHRDLKDKLVLYKDHVEVQLLNEISLRSNSFFGALSNLQALEVETQQCIDNIQSLRKSLVDVTESNIKKSLKVTQLKQFRGNLTQLYSAVKSIGQVKDSKPIIELLIKQSDYVGALDLIEETVTVLRGQTSQQLDAQVPAKERVGTGIHIYRNKSISEHNMDLSAVNAVAHQNDNLAIIVKDLSKVMEAELVNILLSDIKAHLSDILRNPYTIQNLPTTDSKSHIKNSIKSILLEQYSINEVANTAVEANLPHPTLTAKDEELKSKIAPLVSGLLKLDRLEGALVSIKDSFFKEIKKHSETFYPTLNINTPAKTEMSPIGGKIPKNVSSPQITTPKESQTPKEIKRLYEE